MIFLALTAVLAAASPQDVEVIRALRFASNAAIASHDKAGLMSSMAPGFTLLDSRGGFLSGAEKSADDYAAVEFKDPAFIAYERTPEAIGLSPTGAHATERGHWLARRRLPGGGEKQAGGTYLAGWVKSDGQWKIETEAYVQLDCGAMPACDR